MSPPQVSPNVPVVVGRASARHARDPIRSAGLKVFAPFFLLLSAITPTHAQSDKPVPKRAPTAPKTELNLDATTITGSREQPTVLNILPWKRPPAGDQPGAPNGSLLDDSLQPINRVEFRRELRYGEPAAAP